MSFGEQAVESFLKSNNINFTTQVKFDGLLGVGSRQLSYDFYIPHFNLLIEVQGKQHERPIDYFGGEEQFVIQQEHDKRKKDYAKEHNIELLEIWYWDYKNINNIIHSRLQKQPALFN
jgi:very-short-patch-repair endonuclease